MIESKGTESKRIERKIAEGSSQRGQWEVTSFFLHLLAMVCMLCDHLWATVIPGNDWLTCVGRLAFPVFAFLIVEGYFHTGNLKKYVKRLLVCALLSEIPFNLVMGSRIMYPLHQNVLWTFLLGILLICMNENARRRGKWWVSILVGVASVLLACILGLLTMVDYYHAGVLMVLVFYFFHEKSFFPGRNIPGKKVLCCLGQLLLLYYINDEMLGGYGYEVEWLGTTTFVARQSFALLSLLPIWLYRGKQGPYNRVIRYLYYGFYPVHLLILAAMRALV